MNQDVQIIEVMNKPSDINDQGDTEFRIKVVPNPDSSWTHAFDEAYSSSKSNMWRSAEVSGNMILISCHHSQLTIEHMPSIKKAVSSANETYRKIMQAFEANRAKEIAEANKNKKSKEDILREINDEIKRG